MFLLLHIQTVSELNAERQELSEAFKRVKKERDTAEKELDQCREEKDKLENLYTDKIKESNDLAEVRVLLNIPIVLSETKNSNNNNNNISNNNINKTYLWSFNIIYICHQYFDLLIVGQAMKEVKKSKY